MGRKVEAKDKLCPSVLHDRVCNFGDKCKFNHDVKLFMENKPPDIGPECYNFLTFGKCPYGLACRFGMMHISDEPKNIINIELYEKMSQNKTTVNLLEKELQVKLWKKKYDFSKANGNVEKVKKWCQQKTQERVEMQQKRIEVETENRLQGTDKSLPQAPNGVTSCNPNSTNEISANRSADSSSSQTVCDTEGPIKLRNQEKKIVSNISDFVPFFKSSPNPFFGGKFCYIINTLGKYGTGNRNVSYVDQKLKQIPICYNLPKKAFP